MMILNFIFRFGDDVSKLQNPLLPVDIFFLVFTEARYAVWLASVIAESSPANNIGSDSN